MSDRVNGDGIGSDREHDTPVTGSQPHSGNPSQRFYVTDASFRERPQFEVDLRTRRRCQLPPLADRGRGKLDLFHAHIIAERDDKIKPSIA